MDNPDSGNNAPSQGAPLWSTHAPPHLAYVSTTQPSQVLQVSASSSQPNIAGFSPGQYAEMHYHNLQPFHLQQPQVFQQAQSTFDRSSPSVESVDFQQAGPSNADAIQFHGLTTDGAHILRNLPRSAVVTGFPVQVLIGQSSEAQSMSIPVVSSVTTSDSLTSHAVSVSDTTHPSAPLLQVVAAMQEFSQAEANSSEATPLAVHSPLTLPNHSRHDEDPDQSVSSMTYTLQQHPSTVLASKVSRSHIETYTSEADTTQEDTPQHHPHYHSDNIPDASSHYRHDSEYAEAESSDLPMSSSGLDQELDPVSQSGLDSTMAEEVDMETAIASPIPGPSSRQDLLLDGHNTMMLLHAAAENERLSLPLVMPAGHSNLHTVDSSQGGNHGNGMEEQKLRKSDRLATLDRPLSPVQQPVYRSTTYNPNQLWCEDCLMAYDSGCLKHKLQGMYDKVVLSRAWASLPTCLQIFRLGDTSELGVFAKKTIPKRTQFGPYIGELVDSIGKVSNEKFILQLDRENGEVSYFESSDENKCNWMMFVRPAENYAQQNMVAYQYGNDVYFSTIKTIEPKQEILVWYAAHYAERLGVALHPVSHEDRGNEEDKRWPCYECNKRFKTSAQLQQHLAVHDDANHADGSGELDDVDDGDIDEATGQRKAKRRGTMLRNSKGTVKKRGKQQKQAKESDDPTLQSWKKKKSSIYLNKHMKQMNLKGKELVKRSIKSLYRKKGKESGGQEWVCTHCQLTFDNSNLLNLHTLTHAAEDVGLHEIRRQLTNQVVNPGGLEAAMAGQEGAGNGLVSVDTAELTGGLTLGDDQQNLVSLEVGQLECPVCMQLFASKQALIEHASEHARTVPLSKRKTVNKRKPFKCEKCWKSFTIQERLQKHMLCHGDENSKPLQCDVCFKRFMNNSALACHLKIHSDRKYYECQLCHQGFDQILMLKSHVVTHSQNGIYVCPDCGKQFEEYNTIRKHMRAFHSDKKYPCPQCEKIFPRPDKLKLHMLRHSAHREFMCESCGRQFKRKDKLKEHMKRMHTAEREAKLFMKPQKPVVGKKFVPKVSPSDYHRFIYKCHACLLGFKRRGMLVNHLAKRHPDVKPETVPELNLPILRTQRDYFCQYCDKVYKSSSKRKAHILKNHPGSMLPASSRKRGVVEEVPGIPNPTFSQTIGSVTTIPHPCHLCHKQYASKAKLLQHQRKKHPDSVPPIVERKFSKTSVIQQETTGLQERYDTETIVIQTGAAPESMQATDLLTQAMSELTQTLNEYRTTNAEFQIATTRLPNGQTAATLVQPSQPQHSTIELSHLGPALAHTNFVAPQVHIINEVQTQNNGVVTSQPLSPQTLNSVSAVSSAQVTPVALAQVYNQKGWTTATFPTYR